MATSFSAISDLAFERVDIFHRAPADQAFFEAVDLVWHDACGRASANNAPTTLRHPCTR